MTSNIRRRGVGSEQTSQEIGRGVREEGERREKLTAVSNELTKRRRGLTRIAFHPIPDGEGEGGGGQGKRRERTAPPFISGTDTRQEGGANLCLSRLNDFLWFFMWEKGLDGRRWKKREGKE